MLFTFFQFKLNMKYLLKFCKIIKKENCCIYNVSLKKMRFKKFFSILAKSKIL